MKIFFKIFCILVGQITILTAQIIENNNVLPKDLSWVNHIDWVKINKLIINKFDQIQTECIKGEDQAFLDLGFYYLSVEGKRDEILAIRNFRIAAQKGNTTAMMMLHQILWTNEIIPSSRRESIEWLTKADQLNRSDAAYQIYLIAKDNSIDEFKNIDVMQQLEKAVALNSTSAKRELANNLFKRQSQESIKEAFKLFNDLAINDNKKSNYMLGIIKLFGLDGNKDEDSAREYFISSGHDHEYALIQLGKIYLFGRGVVPDYLAAKNYFDMALRIAKQRSVENYQFRNFKSSKIDRDLGSPVSYYMGLMCENGFGVPKNQKKAIKYYKMTKLCPKSYDSLNFLTNGKHKNTLLWWELNIIEEQRSFNKYIYM